MLYIKKRYTRSLYCVNWLLIMAANLWPLVIFSSKVCIYLTVVVSHTMPLYIAMRLKL